MQTAPAEPFKAFAQSRREELVALCADLVAAASPQPAGDTTAPAAVLTAYLERQGIMPEIRAARPDKPNLVCSFDTGRPGPHIILNGHLDTLDPGSHADWTVPVFKMGRSAGRLTGLGIGNMKAGVAALTVAFAGLARNRAQLKGRVTLTLVADEVVFGPDGAAYLLAADTSLYGDALINAEGAGGMNLAIAEKGLLWLSIEASAPPGQGMLSKQGSSAISRLARLLSELDSWNSLWSTPPADVAILSETCHDEGLRLSVNAGTIRGGSFVSQVATTAAAEVDFRVPPGLTIDEIEARVRVATDSVGGITVKRIKGWDPNWTPAEAELCSTLLEAARHIRAAQTLPVVRLPASDAARWRGRGIPAVCYGPQAELASGVDDYVIEDDVVDCVAVYMATTAAMCGFEATEDQ